MCIHFFGIWIPKLSFYFFIRISVFQIDPFSCARYLMRKYSFLQYNTIQCNTIQKYYSIFKQIHVYEWHIRQYTTNKVLNTTLLTTEHTHSMYDFLTFMISELILYKQLCHIINIKYYYKRNYFCWHCLNSTPNTNGKPFFCFRISKRIVRNIHSSLSG